MTREEMISKARSAKTPEELLQMAHEIGMSDFTEENVKAYFDILQKSGENKIDGKKSGELADEELDSTTGGAMIWSLPKEMYAAWAGLNTLTTVMCLHTGNARPVKKYRQTADNPTTGGTLKRLAAATAAT